MCAVDLPMNEPAVRTFVSAPTAPGDRGEEFGAVHAEMIAATIESYRELFAAVAGSAVDLRPLGEEALAAIAGFSNDAAAEIRGIAAGAGLEPWEVAALNARTEILARLGVAARGECSTIVDLRPGGHAPLTMQTWDWHDVFADRWLVWTIEQPDGSVVHTLTEYGILGKIGVSSRGLGVHLNILHHASDGGPDGVPVHILCRAVLDRARDAGEAVEIIGPAAVSASSVITVIGASDAGMTAVGAELAPAGPRYVLPSPDGRYIHTNHFLDPHLAAGDEAPRTGPDSYLRLEVLRRRLHNRVIDEPEDLREILADHSAGAGSVCCHPAEGAQLGDRWATLATVALDVCSGELMVRPGGPCDERALWHRTGATALNGSVPQPSVT